MRRALLLLWLGIPALLGLYHAGPGQEQLRLDEAGYLAENAADLAASGQWSQAINVYNAALERLPKDRLADAQRFRLNRAQAQMQNQQLAEAYTDLSALVDELESQSPPSALLPDARAAMASAQYYLTWLMRLEGEPREAWEPEIEAARQTYRLLAEQAEQAGQTEQAAQRKDDLESSIRLARMDLGELQALSLPCQCKGCKSCNCKGKKPGRKPSSSQNKQDARGATNGPPPDDGGS